MGYWGDFVLVRSDRPLAELSPVLARPGCSDEDDDCLALCQVRPGGWQTAQVCHYLPGDDYPWWLSELVAATGSPVMIATVADSGICQVRALAPSRAGWDTFLGPRSAALPEFLDCYLADTEGETEGETGEGAAQRLLDTVPATADQIARWAAEAGFRADTEALRGILLQEADPFVEDIFFHLIDACGLPDPLPGAQ